MKTWWSEDLLLTACFKRGVAVGLGAAVECWADDCVVVGWHPQRKDKEYPPKKQWMFVKRYDCCGRHCYSDSVAMCWLLFVKMWEDIVILRVWHSQQTATAQNSQVKLLHWSQWSQLVPYGAVAAAFWGGARGPGLCASRWSSKSAAAPRGQRLAVSRKHPGSSPPKGSTYLPMLTYLMNFTVFESLNLGGLITWNIDFTCCYCQLDILRKLYRFTSSFRNWEH